MLFLVTITNCNFDLCNVLFCFCLSGPSTYSYKDEIAYDPGSHVSSVNWIKEDTLTFDDFVKDKHHLSDSWMWLTRLFVFLLVIISFLLFEKLLLINGKLLNYNSEHIKKRKLKASIIISLFWIIGVILFSKVSFKMKHIFNMIVCTVLIFLAIIYAVRELLILNEIIFDI